MSIPLRNLVATWYRGNKMEDPIDGRTYRKFLPYGYEKTRENALSPGTLSLERHRLLWLFLSNKTQFFSERIKLLHIAPEQGFYPIFKSSKSIEYTTFDLESPLAEIKGDIAQMPFEDNTFDWVLCNHVLEHVPDDRQAMKEIYRVLKPRGEAVLQVPLNYARDITYEDPHITSAEDRRKHFGQYDHVREYGRDYFKRLQSIGFEVEEVALQPEIGMDKVKRYGISEIETIPFVRKPSSPNAT